MKNDFLKNNYYSPKFKKFITKLSIDTGFKIYFFLFVFFFILCQLSIIVLDDWSEAKAKKESVPYPNKNYKGRWASCVNLDIIGISHSIYTEGAYSYHVAEDPHGNFVIIRLYKQTSIETLSTLTTNYYAPIHTNTSSHVMFYGRQDKLKNTPELWNAILTELRYQNNSSITMSDIKKLIGEYYIDDRIGRNIVAFFCFLISFGSLMQILKYCYALCKIRKKRLLHLKSLPQSTLYKIDQELNSTYVISQNGLTVTQNYIFSFGMADVYSIHDIECLQLKQEVNFTLYFSLLNSDVLLYIQEYHTNKKGIIKAQNDINTWSQIITLRMLFNKLSLKLFYDFFKKGRAKVSLSHGLYDSYVAIKLTYQMYPLMLDIRI